MSEPSLKDKTVRGVGWSTVDNVSQYAVSFVVSIVLARLLSPDDYGLIGLTTIFVAISNTLIDGGFADALIRKKDITETDYNTAFIVNLTVSIILYVVIFFCSPAIARYFDRVELVSLTRVSSLGIIIGALALVQKTRLTKRIDFKTQTKITLIASLGSGIIGVVMAVLGFGVWALVTQGLLKQLFTTILLWIYNRWTPRLRFSSKSFKYLFGFGWKITISHLLNSIWEELNQVVVGKYYNPATLGHFTRAKQFSTLFSSNLTNVIQRVSFPVLSDLQDDRQRLIAAYRRIIKTTMFVSVVCVFFLGAISEPLLFCLIGPQWHEAALYLPIICISSSLYPLHAINLNMLKVQGRSDLFLGLEIIKKIIALGPLLVGAFVGIMPMLYTSLATGVITYFLNSHYSGKLLGYSSWMQIRDVAPSYGIALVVALSVWFLKYLPLSYWFVLPMQLVVGTSVFFTLCKVTKIKEYEEVKGMVGPFLQKIRRK